jgi:hypothetical protein
MEGRTLTSVIVISAARVSSRHASRASPSAFDRVATIKGAHESIRGCLAGNRARHRLWNPGPGERRRPDSRHGNATHAQRAGAPDDRPRRCATVSAHKDQYGTPCPGRMGYLADTVY